MTENSNSEGGASIAAPYLRLTDGSTWTADAVTRLQEELATSRTATRRVQARLGTLTQGMRDALRELVHEGEVEREKANEILVGLNIEPLESKFEFEATFVLRGYGTATTGDELEEALNDASVEIHTWSGSNAHDIEVHESELSNFRSDRVVE